MITKEMTIEEIISRYPQTLKVFARFGLDCAGCQIASVEALEHGAGVHRVSIDQLLQELNAAIAAPSEKS